MTSVADGIMSGGWELGERTGIGAGNQVATVLGGGLGCRLTKEEYGNWDSTNLTCRET